MTSQVLAALLLRPKHTSKLRRVWNLTHWTLGRAALALAIANIFIGTTISNVAYKHIIAQAVVLGGLFIIVMLKNDIEYLLVGCTPAEEEAKLRAAHVKGMRQHASEMCMTASSLCVVYPACLHSLVCIDAMINNAASVSSGCLGECAI